jgi:ribosomal protein L29
MEPTPTYEELKKELRNWKKELRNWKKRPQIANQQKSRSAGVMKSSTAFYPLLRSA